MTAASIAHLPLQVGGAALSYVGQSALWVIQRYMRNPLTNTAIAALVVATAMAGSNALFGQHREHPAPLFGVTDAMPTGSVEQAPVIPKTRPKTFSVTVPVEAEASQAVAVAQAAPSVPSTPVGNREVFDVQKKLAALNLFSGEVDGYYGPQTASAIRRFEQGHGYTPMGELNSETVQRIMSASLAEPVAAPAAAQPSRPAVAVNLPQMQSTPAETAPSTRTATQSLAQIAPARPLETTGTVLGRPVPATPEAALEMAADTAGDALGTIVDGVQQIAMNSMPERPTSDRQYTAAVQPLANVPAATAAPAAAARVATAVPVATPVATTAAAAAPAAATARTEVASLTSGPQVGVPLQINDAPPKPGEAIAVLDTDATPDEVRQLSPSDPVMVARVQRGLASLGFLHGTADGVAGEATAKAIRNFEVYFNYQVTGRITPGLLDLLVENGAVI